MPPTRLRRSDAARVLGHHLADDGRLARRADGRASPPAPRRPPRGRRWRGTCPRWPRRAGRARGSRRRRAPRRPAGSPAPRSRMPTPADSAISFSARGHAAAGGVAQHVDVVAGRGEHPAHQAAAGRRESLSRVVSNSRPSRTDMMAMPCSAISPLSRITTSPGRARAGAISTPSGTSPMPVVLMNMPSPLPRSTTLVSPVTIGTPAPPRGRPHGLHDAPQVVHGQALLEDEAGRQGQRPRPAHGQVVDRAVHRQRADVAAREEERADHEGVGGEGQAAAGHVEHGAVVARVQRRVAERGQEHVARSASAPRAARRRRGPVSTVGYRSSGIGHGGAHEVGVSSRHAALPYR